MMKVYIYALCEPGTRTVRYIGKTESLEKRRYAHLHKSVLFQSPLGEWLRSLSGAAPNMVVLCETSQAFWQDDETRYIRSARALGMRLVNSTDGGEGGLTSHSPESLAKMSVSQKAAWANPTIGKIRRKAKTTAAVRAKHSRSAKLTWRDPEIRAKRVAGAKANWIKRKIDKHSPP